MKILFMCVANSARSQLAEGLARSIVPDATIESDIKARLLEFKKEIGQ